MMQAQKSPSVDILAFGDSLTYGYELPREASWPFLLEEMLRVDGYAARVINEGVNGETTTGGLMRLPHALAMRPEIVILELGINDAFMGRNPERIAQGLDAMLRMIKETQAKVLLTGMRAFDFMDLDFAEEFNAIYPNLAQKYGAQLLPHFMEGVMDEPAHLMADGVHPNATGTRRLAENIQPYVLEMVKKHKLS